MEIKDFSTVNNKKITLIEIMYQDKNEKWAETKEIIGYGVVPGSYGDTVEPFYYGGEFLGIICPAQDVSNLIGWKIK